MDFLIEMNDIPLLVITYRYVAGIRRLLMYIQVTTMQMQ